MRTKTGDIEQAEANAGAGMYAAEQGAGDWWNSIARQAFQAAAAESYRTGRPFTSYEVTDRFGVPEPEEKRAWGPIVKTAERAGLVQHAGWVRSPRPTGHRTPVSQWVGTAAAVEVGR